MFKSLSYKQKVLLLILISFVIKVIASISIDLGFDEVYYVTYVLYPDYSHFDHPPMLGWIAQLFTLNGTFLSELTLRLSSVVMSCFSIWLIFLIGTKIKNEIVGFYAALLYSGSIYFSIIAGIFLMPDAPVVFFWLLSLYFAIKAFENSEISSNIKFNIIYFGIFAGLAMISKYHAAFLWFGIGFYILLYDRKWFKYWQLYIAAFISLCIFSTVIIWNIQNDFISFNFHTDRVDFLDYKIRLDYLLTEITGKFFYSNPINYILALISIFFLLKNKLSIDVKYKRLLLLTGVPIWAMFFTFSLFRSTLPHWAEPAFISFTLITAIYLYDRQVKRGIVSVPKIIKYSIGLIVLLVTLGIFQINYGIIPLKDSNANNSLKIGKNDVTLDMFGWKQLKNKFEVLRNDDIKENRISNDAAMIYHKWFPAAHYDYYVAMPLKMKTLVIGELVDIHKYYWINKERGMLKPGDDAYYIALSTSFTNPNELYKNNFDSICPADTIHITRNNVVVKNAMVYRLLNYKK